MKHKSIPVHYSSTCNIIWDFDAVLMKLKLHYNTNRYFSFEERLSSLNVCCELKGISYSLGKQP